MTDNNKKQEKNDPLLKKKSSEIDKEAQVKEASIEDKLKDTVLPFLIKISLKNFLSKFNKSASYFKDVCIIFIFLKTFYLFL